MASASKIKYQSGSSYLHGLRKIKVIVVCSRAAFILLYLNFNNKHHKELQDKNS